VNIARVSKSLILGLAVLLASSAFASNSNKGSLQLSDPASIGGTQLKAGNYDVKWDGEGANVQVNVLKGSKVVATVPAHLIDLADKPSNDSAVVKKNADGTESIAEIHFSGKKQALAIGNNTSSNYGSTQ
jgi:hypothetical protein